MTAVTAAAQGGSTARAGAPASLGPTFPRVLTSEWIKFRTLRSTVWTLGVTVLLMIGFSVLVAWGTTTMPPEFRVGVSIAALISGSVFMAQLAVMVLGVLAITGEYTTGMIRSTLAAVPTRLPALWAKAVVVFVVVALVAAVGTALSYVATIPFHDDLGVTLDLADGESLRILLGIPLYLATVGLLAFAVGALMRHSAGALAAVFGLVLVVEGVFALIPVTFFEKVSPYLPSTAGARLFAGEGSMMGAPVEGMAVLSPWEGYAVLAAWVIVLLVAAAVLLRRRDA